MPQSSAFISYHHDDRIIGETLREQLAVLAAHGEGRPAVSTFLDAKDIRAGVAWKPVIDVNLANKDWLIVVFTGEQSVYCGYEIGTFSQLHAQAPDKRIMGLYDVDDERIPVVLRDSQNTLVAPVDTITDAGSVVLPTGEVNFWFHSAVGQFLADFCSYRGLYTPEHEKEDPAAYSNAIALSAKRIANAFALARGTDVKSETPTQISFELTIKGNGNGKLEKIPADSAVVGTSLFFNTLGLDLPVSWDQAPNTTWEELKRKLSIDGRRDVPWMHKIEIDVVQAADSRTISGSDVTFRGQNGKVYRPILVRHKLFVNGDRRFYLLFVETLDRRFVGSPHSSLLLTALILASRWRFTYFERWSDTVDRVFGTDVSLPNFVDGCKQLLYNIEWIEHESVELGTADLNAVIDAFGSGEHRARVERFFKDWARARETLAKGLPGLEFEITSANRGAVRDAVLAFLRDTRGQNTEFLELALGAYSERITADLARERMPGG